MQTRSGTCRRSTLLLLLFLVSVLSLGCGGNRRTQTPTHSDQAPFSWVYSCEDLRFSAIATQDQVRLDLGTRILRLPRVRSASGAKYSDGETTFFAKRNEALLQFSGQAPNQCQGVPARNPWEEAALRGVVFRAVGQEPGWTLEIVPEKWMRLVLDYGTRLVIFPEPKQRQGPEGETLFRAEAEQPIKVAVRRELCRDSMSGESFPLRVTVLFQERTLHGCGRFLPSLIP